MITISHWDDVQDAVDGKPPTWTREEPDMVQGDKPRTDVNNMGWSDKARELAEGNFLTFADREEKDVAFADDGTDTQTTYDGKTRDGVRFAVTVGGKALTWTVTNPVLLNDLIKLFPAGTKGKTARVRRIGTAKQTTYLVEAPK